MKYIISENRLHEFMASYLDSLLRDKVISHEDHYIVISDKSDDDEWNDIMEFDHSEARLWINLTFLEHFDDLFGRGPEESLNFIARWFEEKFNVKIKYHKSWYLHLPPEYNL